MVLISLFSGVVLDHALAPNKGKGTGTGEHALLRKILPSLPPGDILVGDRYYCSYFLIAMLTAAGNDVLFQQCADDEKRIIERMRSGELPERDKIRQAANENKQTHQHEQNNGYALER